MRSLAKIVKRKLYFVIAAWFGFWAALYLKRWRPSIVTVIGSSGKTTMLHLLAAQFGSEAVVSYQANSAFGIPFHILGLKRVSYSSLEWPLFFFLAPFKVFRAIPQERLYITEADAERPGEAPFLARLLQPDILIWLSLAEAHGVNYDTLASRHFAGDVRKAMAAEFAAFIPVTKHLLILNDDNPYIKAAAGDVSNIKVIKLSSKDVLSYQPLADSARFQTSASQLSIPHLVPAEVGLSALAVKNATEFLQHHFDPTFTGFALAPGRSSVFAGKKDTVFIDSTYNATISGMEAMLGMFRHYPAAGPKWLVLGDMVEQGRSEAAEHQQLAAFLQSINAQKIILVGPRLKKYTQPLLEKNTVAYDMPAEALHYMQKELHGGETILFKGARFLEGIVEALLAHTEDAEKLCRREPIWVKRRKAWGL